MTQLPTAPGREWLLELRPRGPIALDSAASSSPRVAETIAHVGEEPVRCAIEVGHAMAVTITREIPVFGGGDGPFQMLRKGTESSTLRSLVLLAFPAAELQPITEEALEGDRDFVRRGIALDKVLRGIRLGHAGMAQAFLGACEDLVAGDRLADEMKAVSEDLFRYIDSFSDSMVVEFLAERDRWITSAAAARDETVRHVLSGDDIDVRAATSVLSYDLHRRHLALIAWVGRESEASDLGRVAAAELAACGATSTLMMPVGSSALWAWGVLPGSGPTATPSPAPVVRDTDVHVARGLPGRGVEGFRRSHQQAARAERLARLAGDRAARSTDYADVSAITLLAEDLPSARDFVARELGPLATRTSAMPTLRETLLRSRSVKHCAGSRARA
ncbi:hypothetical protein [Pseudonocardia xishanensis]|uniref:CdaR GGDEF-like domain-containing protein n=1 Tax=Pseudonocardia xishanensis TaxID=630995 RepID=A0ABP8S413_9PSEU